jgi:thymidylate kinase
MFKQKIKMILVEGPDCSGKSTLVERLKNSLHWDSKTLHHRGGDQFERYIKEYILAENIVFDRGHLSEMVYSELWRAGNSISINDANLLEKLLLRNSIIIFSCPKISLMKKRYRERKFEQQIKFTELTKSKNLFIKYFKNLPHERYYSESFSELEKLILKIKSKINK